MTTTYTIDATGKALGRVASEAAKMLMGKTLPSYRTNTVPTTTVTVTNVKLLKLTEKKLQDTSHARYSGYPGGLKYTTYAKTIEKAGHQALLLKAISGMIPKNKLHKEILSHLKISE